MGMCARLFNQSLVFVELRKNAKNKRLRSTYSAVREVRPPNTSWESELEVKEQPDRSLHAPKPSQIFPRFPSSHTKHIFVSHSSRRILSMIRRAHECLLALIKTVRMLSRMLLR
jgi:hypothetical protein